MTNKPRWAVAKVKIYFATCWIDSLISKHPKVCGVNWINDKFLAISSILHNNCIRYFLSSHNKLPIRILEEYEEDDSFDWSR